MTENKKFGVLDTKDKKELAFMEKLLEEKYQAEKEKKLKASAQNISA